jgi:hypothetical protein
MQLGGFAGWSWTAWVVLCPSCTDALGLEPGWLEADDDLPDEQALADAASASPWGLSGV